MYDEALAQEIVQRLRHATATILQRFAPVKTPLDLTASPHGQEKFDSNCMLLIAIGEGLKNLDKVTAGTLLPLHPQVDWKKAKGLRDVISHRYFDVDAEEIFYICTTHVPAMLTAFDRMISAF